ncbi:MAG: Photosynthetic reaction center cytochrome c subunit precursor [Acidobacteria bacterium OLB17]|nr:MAG: Photosynthetic reaction center cytochrome c subunit precursor [Acidobacteria bacterium OLB17]MCZ2391229.1 c-type cytochrome [Acidobacteriota bacterium]
MKKKIKLAVIVCAAAVFVFAMASSRQSAQTRGPQVETIGQRFKNIKVLTDVLADQLGKLMNIFSASLNVNCSFCHYTDDFSKDGKEEKEMARKMIAMTFSINKEHFGGETEISCNTCHNGQMHPQSRPSLEPTQHSAGHGPRPGQPTAKPEASAVIAKFVAAVGGDKKVESAVVTAERLEPDGKTVEPETINFKSGKYSAKVVYGKQWVTDLWDGAKAAKFGPDGSHRLHSDEAEQIRREAQLLFPAAIGSAYSKFEYRFADKIDGRQVYVLIGTTADGFRERLSFDAESGLLVRRVASTPTVLGSFVYQVDYRDYKNFDGVKVPTVVKYAMPNIYWTRKVSSVKLNVPVADDVFAVPGS